MFETLRRHPLLVLSQAARDPLDTLAALQDSFHSRIESANTIGYIADPDWESALRRRLGMSSESEGEGFWPLWSAVVETLRAQGMAVGPFSFHEWNDGDAGLGTGNLVFGTSPATRQRGRNRSGARHDVALNTGGV